MHPDNEPAQREDLEAATGIEPVSRVLQELERLLTLAIVCQHLYIEARLGVPLGPVSDLLDGCAQDD